MQSADRRRPEHLCLGPGGSAAATQTVGVVVRAGTADCAVAECRRTPARGVDGCARMRSGGRRTDGWRQREGGCAHGGRLVRRSGGDLSAGAVSAQLPGRGAEGGVGVVGEADGVGWRVRERMRV